MASTTSRAERRDGSIRNLRGAQARTLLQSLLLRDLSQWLRRGITWHGPRHTFCSWLEMAGATTIEIKEAAGTQTMSQATRYAHLSPKHKRSVVNRIAVTITESEDRRMSQESPRPTCTSPPRARKEQSGMTEINRRNLFNLLTLDWCRRSNPNDRKGRRILSPNLGMLQQAARQRTDSHNVHRMRNLSSSANLQEVAVTGSNVEPKHAPKHALNFGGAMRFESGESL
jgi:hypothetical protein